MLCDGLFAVTLTNAIPQKINSYGESVTHCLTLQACFKSHNYKRSDERKSDIENRSKIQLLGTIGNIAPDTKIFCQTKTPEMKNIKNT